MWFYKSHPKAKRLKTTRLNSVTPSPPPKASPSTQTRLHINIFQMRYKITWPLATI